MRSLPALRVSCFAFLVAGAVGLGTYVTVQPAHAQSAADKTVARDLAVAGINSYGEGNHAEALSKLERAQALYDAHVHLVYIARCQTALGKLVEAAETYRALARKPLPPDASEAVRNAQSEGATELKAVEPRIPRLRIEVTPTTAPDLRLSINGQAVPAAAVGVDRPTNPGEAVVRVGATGYKSAELSVVLGEGESKSVSITLEEGEGGPPVVEGEEVGPGRVPPGETSPAGVTPPADEPIKRPVSFVLEPRLSPIIGFGRVSHSAMPEMTGPGFGGELRLGVHFLRRLTAMLVGGGWGVTPKTGFEDTFAFAAFDDPRTDLDESGAIESGKTSTLWLVDLGGGVMVSSRHHRYGWFAEVDFLYEMLMGSTKITIVPQSREDYEDCTVDTRLGGIGGRLIGGGVIPISKHLQTTPFVGVTLANFGSLVLSGDCEQRQEVQNDTTHGWVTLGIGGQFLIGE
ncbi:MAG: hypothetical protein JW751_23385 [Polyangiaceae bacterium]|nr:hypothetical protein [Polyangiaceae bacterium]